MTVEYSTTIDGVDWSELKADLAAHLVDFDLPLLGREASANTMQAGFGL